MGQLSRDSRRSPGPTPPDVRPTAGPQRAIPPPRPNLPPRPQKPRRLPRVAPVAGIGAGGQTPRNVASIPNSARELGIRDAQVTAGGFELVSVDEWPGWGHYVAVFEKPVS